MTRPLTSTARALAEQLLARTTEQGAIDAESDVRLREQLQREQDAAARRLRRSNVEGSGITIPDEAYALTIAGGLQATMALRAVDVWLDMHSAVLPGKSPARILILAGGTGCGKTVAAAWAIARLGGRHMHSDTFAEAVGSRWNDDRALVARVLGTRLVVLDDVGAERDQARASAALYRFVDARQRRPALSILTTNLVESDLHARLDARTVSRLVQVARFIPCAGPDLRRRAARDGGGA